MTAWAHCQRQVAFLLDKNDFFSFIFSSSSLATGSSGYHGITVSSAGAGVNNVGIGNVSNRAGPVHGGSGSAPTSTYNMQGTGSTHVNPSGGTHSMTPYTVTGTTLGSHGGRPPGRPPAVPLFSHSDIRFLHQQVSSQSNPL